MEFQRAGRTGDAARELAQEDVENTQNALAAWSSTNASPWGSDVERSVRTATDAMARAVNDPSDDNIRRAQEATRNAEETVYMETWGRGDATMRGHDLRNTTSRMASRAVDMNPSLVERRDTPSWKRPAGTPRPAAWDGPQETEAHRRYAYLRAESQRTRQWDHWAAEPDDELVYVDYDSLPSLSPMVGHQEAVTTMAAEGYSPETISRVTERGNAEEPPFSLWPATAPALRV